MGTITNGGTIPPGPNGTFLAGRYRVVSPLGQGGMGSVWLAEDTKLDGYKVAIKMLPSILVNNKRAYAQVKAEALVSLKLSHSNIATVRAFEEESGSPFLVMDYIDGQTLDDYLAEKGKLTEEETVRLLKPVAAALDYAHSQGVVHRDVKPGNVMIRKDGTPFVLDFGIAREIQETMTRVTGKLSSGTLLYMSPEQLHGDAPKPSQDIYSFAAMAYECLVGHPPFYRGQIEYQIVNNKPEPLDPQFANCGPGVMAGLEKLPENRPERCAAVLLPSEAQGAKAGDADDGALAGRARGAAVLLGVLAFAAAVGGGWWWRESVKGEELRMKKEAESHLVPTLRFVAKVGDREVSATAMFDGKPYTSPWRWEENVKPDSRIPSTDVAVEYAEGGKRYVGTIKPVTVDWKGPKTVVVMLTEYKGPKPGDMKTITLPGGATLEMVWCPPGSFMMGSPTSENPRNNDETQHKVMLTKGFWMGKYEVTQRQWESVMGDNPSRFKGADRPVEQVSWNDCQEFIRKINASGEVMVSLPTEAQWEYACRAGTTTPFSFGSSLNGDKANCDGNYPYGTTAKGQYREATAPVGSYSPNAWGLYDMHGNVWEWCADWYGDYPTGSVTDPTGPASGSVRVDRGGSWFDGAQGCRSADRGGNGPGDRDDGLGFRLVCSAGPRR